MSNRIWGILILKGSLLGGFNFAIAIDLWALSLAYETVSNWEIIKKARRKLFWSRIPKTQSLAKARTFRESWPFILIPESFLRWTIKGLIAKLYRISNIGLP